MKSKTQVLEDVESFGLMTGLTWIEPPDKDIKRLFAEVLDNSELADQIAEDNLGTVQNLNLIIAKAKQKFGPEFGAKEFLIAATPLVKLGQLEPREEPEVEPEPERDSLGRVLSPKALQWKRWEEWVSDPQTKMSDVHALRNSNPAFREFYQTTQAKQFSSTPVGDGVTPAGEPTKGARVSQELLDFARRYNRTAADRLKPRGGYIELDGTPMLHKDFVELHTRAINARLI